jgi:tetratricopeptide (TPR) repeat protein
MTPIQVYITSGQNAGRRLVLSDASIPFGRSGQNKLVIDVPSASREQGELKFDGQQWWLHNHSTNGTRVGRKTVRKATQLNDGDVVSVGDEELFRISLGSGADADAPGDPGALPAGPRSSDLPTEPAKAKLSKKTKIIVGVAIYLAAMVLVFVVFGQLFTSDSGLGELGDIKKLTDSEIAAEITGLVEPAEDLDADKANRALRDANDYYENRRRNTLNYYRAYEKYREALHFLQQTRFDDAELDPRYREVRSYLVKEVTEAYELGTKALDDNKFRRASEHFGHVLDLFPDDESSIHQSANELRRIARIKGESGY